MKKPLKLNFKGRPDRACSTDELRPIMNYIYIDEGCMVATNGMILVKIPINLSDLGGDEKLLEGCYIHKKQYVELLRHDVLQISGKAEITAKKRIGKDYFSTIFKLKQASDFTPEYQGHEPKFPNYKNVLDFKPESIEKIGISKFRIEELMSCFDGLLSTGSIRFEFQTQNRAIHLHSCEHEGLFGLIMPVMLPENMHV